MTGWPVIVSGLAALASTASFAPQAVKTIRSRQTKDLLTWMYVLTVTAFALWTVFGAATRQWALVASNAICLLLSSLILAIKLHMLMRRKAD